MIFTLKCTCGWTDESDTDEGADKIALEHIGDGGTHVVTCTRPARGMPGAIDVIVFIANPERRPKLMRYVAKLETYPVQS